MQHEKKERKLAGKDTWPVGFSPRKELPDALVFKGVFLKGGLAFKVDPVALVWFS